MSDHTTDHTTSHTTGHPPEAALGLDLVANGLTEDEVRRLRRRIASERGPDP